MLYLHLQGFAADRIAKREVTREYEIAGKTVTYNRE
jgi:hypothetical protein